MSPESATTGSRAPQEWAKAVERFPDQPSRKSYWTGGVCVDDMPGSDDRVNGDTSAGGLEPTDGTSLATDKAVVASGGVGGIRSSVDPMPDLWWAGEPLGERRDATCSTAEKRSKGQGDGPRGLPTPDKVRKLQITLYRKLNQTGNGTRKAGCGKTACPV